VITERATFLALLDAYAKKLDRREAAIAATLRTRPSTLDELVAQRFLYPQGYDLDFVDSAERRTTSQHLDALVAAGRVRVDGGRYFATT
jgi:hypothetical protein